MTWIESLILGLIQGLTEFLPISSSGHLEIGKVLLNVSEKENMLFTIVVHGGTVLSTLVVFYQEIIKLIRGSLEFKWNSSLKYILMIAVSMIPVAIVGLFFEEKIESLFTGNLVLVGCMLLFTAALLAFAYFTPSGNKELSFFRAFIIGIAQAIAVIPGISRSGATISTGLMLRNKKEEIAQFSFLMVLIPIIGANLKMFLSDDINLSGDVNIIPLLIGFLAAFVSGFLACKWMIAIVKRGKLIYFSIYCLLVGILGIVFGIIS